MNVRKFPWRLISNEIFYDTSSLLQVLNWRRVFSFLSRIHFLRCISPPIFCFVFLLRFSASFRCELLCKGEKKVKQRKHLSQKWFVHSSNSSVCEAHTHQVLKKNVRQIFHFDRALCMLTCNNKTTQRLGEKSRIHKNQKKSDAKSQLINSLHLLSLLSWRCFMGGNESKRTTEMPYYNFD